MTLRGPISLQASCAVGFATATMALGILGITVLEAWPHDAPPTKAQPLGWQYDYSCCSAMDCRQIDPVAVSETAQGYTIKLTGEVIPYGDKRIKRSKDEFFHQCTIGGDPKAKHSICLYAPDKGF